MSLYNFDSNGNSHLMFFDMCYHVDVVCISVEDDIDDTAFVVHPIVPGDLTLGALKGTPDYDLGMGLVQAFLDAAMPDGCTDVGKFGLASYPWLDATDKSDVSIILSCRS